MMLSLQAWHLPNDGPTLGPCLQTCARGYCATLYMPRLGTFATGTVMSFILRDLEHFAYGFGKSCGVILASEIGDKTFFIAAVSVAAFAAM